MPMQTLNIANKNGRKFLVQIVEKGDKYGRDKCLTHNEEMPMVEFYDLSYPEKFGVEGQFVSRYYLDTLKAHDRHCCLDLQGDVKEWKVDGYAMDEVLKWLPNPKTNKCDDCGEYFDKIIGCPDGAEICQECFDSGRH